jgi:hypothetical protein
VRSLGLAVIVCLCALGCPASPRVVDLRPDTAQPVLPDTGQEQPSISASSSSLDFGSVGVGDSHEKELVLVNVGGADLAIEEVRIADEDAPFEVVSLARVLLPPTQETVLTLAFAPVANGSANSSVHIVSDDPERPTLTVDLNGQGDAPVLQVEPSALNLGPSWVGEVEEAGLWLYNAGNEALLVNEVSFETASEELGFVLDEAGNGPLPWALAPQDTRELGVVGYTPLDERDDQAFLTVGSSDGRVEDLRIEVLAQARYWAQETDSFTVPIGAVDLVMAVDRSQSMDPFLPVLQAAIPSLVDALAARNLDLHLAAVVDDDGCVNGAQAWLDQGSGESEVAAAWSDMLTTDGGSSLAERPFLLLEQALSTAASGSGGCNEGLIRGGAGLHLIGVSDEHEQSGGSWESHLATLQAFGFSPEMVVLHAIAGDDAGCGASAFDGFSDAVSESGGLGLSLCSADLEGDLEGLAAAVAGVAGSPETAGPYALTQQPVTGTIVPEIDGVVVREGWRFDAESNSLIFDASSAPPPGALLEIGYAVPPSQHGGP